MKWHREFQFITLKDLVTYKVAIYLHKFGAVMKFCTAHKEVINLIIVVHRQSRT